MPLLTRLRNWHHRRLTRLGVLRDPAAEASAAVAHALPAGFSWLWLFIGAWVAMLGAHMAATTLIADQAFFVKASAALVAALPTAYALRFSRFSRRGVNLTVLAVTILLGTLEAIFTWPPEGVYAFYGLIAGFQGLVKVFVWVMVFRAFALRTLSDLVLSVIPAVSCVILVLVARPTPLAFVGTGLLVLAALYLLAAEHAVATHQEGDAVLRVRQVVWERGPRRGAAVNTWHSVSLVVLLAATLAGAGASSLRLSSEIGHYVQLVLAQYLASYLVGERHDYSPESVVALTGEPPVQGDRVLFVVRCSRGENWRQQVYARYTGQSWQQVRRLRITGARRGGVWVTDRSLVSGFRSRGAVPVTQVFEMRTPMSVSLPGLFVATRVRANVFGVQTGEDGTVTCAGYLKRGDTYQVLSLVPAEGSAPRDDPLPPLAADLRGLYLQLPDGLPPRVGELARQVTAGARSPYEQAVMVQSHLSHSYPYDLSTERRPAGRDFVDHFLFDARSGYCNHYASAMVVMCRTLGLPARFVTGFVPGEYRPATDSYEVNAKDGHSWAEVYIEGRGWQSFEPTPPADEREQKRTVVAIWNAVRGALAYLPGAIAAGLRRPPAPVAGGALALIVLAGAVIVRRRRAAASSRLRGRGVTPTRRALFVYAQMARWLARFGHARRRSQPPLEYLAAVRAAAGPLAPEAEQVTHCYLRARYGREKVTEEEAGAAEAALARLRHALFTEHALRRSG